MHEIQLTRRSLLSTATAATAASPMLWIPAAAAAVRPSGVHLGFGADPMREMSVSWSTPHTVRRPRLELGVDRTLGTTVDVRSNSARRVGTVYHHADLDGLEPDTTYYYRLSHAGSSPATGRFTTAPSTPRAFRFAAFGDMGIDGPAPEFVSLIESQDPDFSFVVGDLCYADLSGGLDLGVGTALQDLTIWDKWLRLISPNARHSPWMPTVGNHEMEAKNGELGYAGYLDRLALPGNGARGGQVTYSFVYGNAAFIALDGNDASYEIPRNRRYLGKVQDAWLVQRLTELRARPEIDFIVVGFHNCMFSCAPNHGSDGGNRSRWQPIFDRFSVDLVVNGHNHYYERSHALRDGAIVQKAPRGAVVDSAAGTTYLTAGAAGHDVAPLKQPRKSAIAVAPGKVEMESCEWSAGLMGRESIAFIDVTPRDADGLATMTVVARGPHGQTIDRVRLERRAPIATGAPAA